MIDYPKSRSQEGNQSRVRLMIPAMPTAGEFLPLLADIEKAGIYTNQGPICQQFERLFAQFVAASDDVHGIALSNATIALELALSAVSSTTVGRSCLLPAWTFAATAHAVVRAGLKPVFMDVDASTWMISPKTVLLHLDGGMERPAAIVVVSPFGAPVPTREWDEISKAYKIPIVFDCAAGFDRANHSKMGINVFSLHATKPVAAGEGGIIVCMDEPVAEKIRRAANFGFDAERVATISGTNAKFSEYQAAIAIASMRRWPLTRVRLSEIASIYLEFLSGNKHISFQSGWGTHWLSTSLNIRTSIQVSGLAASLGKEGVEARSWWNGVLPDHQAFAAFQNDTHFPEATLLANYVIGLPFHAFLSDEDVMRVCQCILKCVQ